MNKILVTLILVGLLILITTHLSGCSNQEDTATENSVETETVLGVDDAVRHLKPDTTARTVTGVVLTVTPENNLLTLIDVEEYKICGLSSCCLYMPVKWQGEMPNIEDVVTVTGVIDSSESGLAFTAGELHVTKSAETQ